MLFLFYIFIAISTCFIKNKSLNIFNYLGTWPKSENESWKSFIIKVIELLPLVILIVYMKKLVSSVGIINPENITGDIIDNNKEEDH